MTVLVRMSCIVSVVVLACCGGNIAQQIAKPPTFEPTQSKCAVAKSQTKPLIVEWPSTARGELESKVRGGLVAVHYSGCELEVVDRCRATGAYSYHPITRKTDHVTIRDTDDLYASIPLGAARLESKLEKSGQLDVDMTLVGRWEADTSNVQLSGADCARATHVVSAVSVGAFTFLAGANAAVGASGSFMGGPGGGAKSQAKVETINEDGDVSACKRASLGDKGPPDSCGALLQIEVVPVTPPAPAVEQKTATAPASVACPAGTKFDGARCVATINTSCPSGLHFESGKGCVPDMVTAPVGGACSTDDAAACRRSCDGGDMIACTTLGFQYETGKGVVPDAALAASLYKRGCAGGVPIGCYDLGFSYERGRGVARDANQAMTLYKQACDAKELRGCDGLGRLLRDVQHDHPRAVEQFKRACDARFARSCVALGSAYGHGEGVPADQARANELYKQGCDLGEPQGCTNLAYNTMSGVAMPADPAAALALYVRACGMQNGQACNNGGIAYQNGTGAPADNKRAVELYRQACSLGYADGCGNYGNMQVAGAGTPLDRAGGVTNLRNACSGGHAWSCNRLKEIGETP